MLFAVGGSTERDESLRNLQGGGHDPRRRGFNVQAVELGLVGALDPNLRGEAHTIYFIDEWASRNSSTKKPSCRPPPYHTAFSSKPA